MTVIDMIKIVQNLSSLWTKLKFSVRKMKSKLETNIYQTLSAIKFG